MTISHQRALTYLSNTFDSIPNVDELLQLVEIEFIRRDAVENSANSELPSYSHRFMTFIGILRFSFFENFVGTFGTIPVSISIHKSESTLLIIRNV